LSVAGEYDEQVLAKVLVDVWKHWTVVPADTQQQQLMMMRMMKVMMS